MGDSEKGRRTKVIYAGASERRLAALGQIRGVDVSSFEGGAEPDIRNVLKIAFGKIEHVYPMVLGSTTDENHDDYYRTLIVAADARTEIHRPTGKGKKSTFESKGKPKTSDDAWKNMQLMSRQAERDGRGLYRVAASSAAQTVLTRVPERINTVSQTQSAEVYLNAGLLKHLSTEDGFSKYIEEFTNFYNSPLYTGENFTPPTLFDISGGISLPVLLRMGVVDKIGDQKITRKRIDDLYKSVRKALLVVAVGFGPKVLREIDTKAYDQVLQWEWLNGVTRAALDMD